MDKILTEPEILSGGHLQSWQIEMLLSKARVRSVAASRQIGKSVLLRAICLTEGVQNPGITILYLCPTIKMARSIGFRPMFLSHDSIFPKHLIKSINKTDMSVELVNNTRIVFSGTEALDRLRGVTCDLLLLDEFAFMDPEVMTVLEPVISARNGRIVIASTPRGYNHFYDTIQKGVLNASSFTRGYRSWIVPIDDERVRVPNKEHRINNAKTTMSSQAFEQEYRCSFTTAVGLVYSSFDIAFNNSTLKLDTKLPLFVGMDFNVAKFCATVGQRIIKEEILPDGRKVRTDHFHVLDEVILHDSNTQAMANELLRRYPQWRGRIIVYPDASGSARKTSAVKNNTDHSILRAAGLTVQVPGKNPEISNRVNSVNAMFCNANGDRRLFVNTASCPELVKSLLGQAYKNGKPEKRDGEADLSGPVDALGYSIHYIYPIKSNTVTQTNAFGYR